MLTKKLKWFLFKLPVTGTLGSGNGSADLQLVRHKIHHTWLYDKPFWFRAITYTIGLPLWPIAVLWIGSKFLRFRGKKVANKTGVSRFQQAATMLWLAGRYGLTPQLYYIARLFTPVGQAERAALLSNNDVIRLNIWLNRHADTTVLGDKMVFQEKCAAAGIRVVTSIAVIQHGSIQWHGDFNELPETDVIIKPVSGSRGAGVSCWKWQNGIFVSLTGEQSCAGAELLDLLIEQAAEDQEPLLIQPLFLPADTIFPEAQGAPLTCRLVSGITPQGEVKIIGAVAEMQAAPWQHGRECLFGAVGRQSGCLQTLCSAIKYPDIDLLGNAQQDSILPDWQNAVLLTQQAHRLFAAIPFIGWDIIWSESEPLLLEGNNGWGPGNFYNAGVSADWADRFSRIAAMYIR